MVLAGFNDVVITSSSVSCTIDRDVLRHIAYGAISGVRVLSHRATWQQGTYKNKKGILKDTKRQGCGTSRI